MKEKRGFSLSFEVMVVVILALLLIGVLIFVFTSSSTDFFNRTNSFSSESNIGDIVENCNRLVELNSEYSYCCVNQTVKISSEEEIDASCFSATNYSWGGRITKLSCSGVC